MRSAHPTPARRRRVRCAPALHQLAVLLVSLRQEVNALRKALRCQGAIAAPPPHPPARRAAARPSPVERVTLRADGGLTGHRELVVGNIGLPLSAQTYLLCRALAAAPRGQFVEVPDLLDTLAALREAIAPQGTKSGAHMTAEDVHRLVNKLRLRLKPLGLEHLLQTSACKGGGYRLNALIVEVPPEAPGR